MKLGTTWGILARAAGGRLVLGSPEDRVESISTDTRLLAPEQAFWVLRGPRYDAHNLLDEALAQRASGWVIEQGRPYPKAAKPRHLVEVTDTLKALQAFAAHHRARFEIPVVGITGSNGKTTTKEMLKGICSGLGPTCASPGNWNNQVGVPLSVLELAGEHRYAIFELADSHPGDIAEVARVAQPTIAVLTNLGRDHLEFYGSMEANFKTKSELVEALPPEGKAVINIDDEWLGALESRLGERAVTFGMSPRARVSFAEKGELIVDRHKIKLTLRSLGRISRYNAAAAAAAALALGIGAEKIREGLESYRPSNMRLQVMSHPSGALLVMDAYNANPDSMRAAIEGFIDEFPVEEKVLVLGDMKELGADSRKFHEELAAWLAGLPLRSLYLAGPEMEAAGEVLREAKPKFRFLHADSIEGLFDSVRAELAPARAVFLKASRAMRFEAVLENLSCSTI
ncbi:MAG: UDP-N-acetylmuramoyl-tripeptide--D-alanyl-D-alanine ligase [Elusimicrobia bacterium]|nr:UDP-N-acetylmuramoyl-tripeptide--D-alanyl-D-alanine ligase [Elusimicrobiota bacterium]